MTRENEGQGGSMCIYKCVPDETGRSQHERGSAYKTVKSNKQTTAEWTADQCVRAKDRGAKCEVGKICYGADFNRGNRRREKIMARKRPYYVKQRDCFQC